MIYDFLTFRNKSDFNYDNLCLKPGFGFRLRQILLKPELKTYFVIRFSSHIWKRAIENNELHSSISW